LYSENKVGRKDSSNCLISQGKPVKYCFLAGLQTSDLQSSNLSINYIIRKLIKITIMIRKTIKCVIMRKTRKHLRHDYSDIVDLLLDIVKTLPI